MIERRFEEERLLIGINADANAYQGYFQPGCTRAQNLLNGKEIEVTSELKMEPYECFIWKV